MPEQKTKIPEDAVPLPDSPLGKNAWARLIQESELTVGQRKKIRRLSFDAVKVGSVFRGLDFDSDDEEQQNKITELLTGGKFEDVDNVREGILVIRLKEWSYEQGAPSSVDELQELPVVVYDALLDAVDALGEKEKPAEAPKVFGQAPAEDMDPEGQPSAA